jgi:hypothetical protein
MDLDLPQTLAQVLGVASTSSKFGIELEVYLEPPSMIFNSGSAVAAKVGEVMSEGGLQVKVAEKD